MLPQIVQKRQPLLESFDILAHSRFFASGTQRRQVTPKIPGKDGGRKDFSYSRSGQRISRVGVIQDNGPLWSRT
jgi:hypothetical protein